MGVSLGRRRTAALAAAGGVALACAGIGLFVSNTFKTSHSRIVTVGAAGTTSNLPSQMETLKLGSGATASVNVHYSPSANAASASATNIVKHDLGEPSSVQSATDAYVALTTWGSAYSQVLSQYYSQAPEFNASQSVYVVLAHGSVTVFGQQPVTQWLIEVNSTAPGNETMFETGFNAAALPDWFSNLTASA